jgi:hypothetical protein
MSTTTARMVRLALLVLPMAGLTGCQWPFNTYFGPPLNVPWPKPVSTYFQQEREDAFWNEERYNRVPTLEPLTAEGPHIGMDEPSDDEVMRALEKARTVAGGVPLLSGKFRNNVHITKEKIADYIDPPRFYPLIGPAQVHHVHYKCTVYFTETYRNGWPLPYTQVDEDTREVVYIDHNHLHRVGTQDPVPLEGL